MSASSQGLQPIGSWRDHLPYGSVINVEKTSDAVIAATPYSIFFHFPADNSIERLSKVNGLHEAAISSIAYNAEKKVLVVGYESGGIDLVTNSGIRYIEDIRRSPITGSKRIFQIYISGNLAYLSTRFGIVVIDLNKFLITATLQPGSNGVTDVAVKNDSIFAITNEGLKSGALSSNLQDFRNWQSVNAPVLTSDRPVKLISHDNNLYAIGDTSLYISSTSGWRRLFTSQHRLVNISAAGQRILITERSGDSFSLSEIDVNGAIVRTIAHNVLLKRPLDVIELNNTFYIADSLRGLISVENNSFNSIVPSSPFSVAAGEMSSSANLVAVAASGLTDTLSNLINRGFYIFQDQVWKNYNGDSHPILATVTNFNSIKVDRVNNVVWAGSYQDGLFRLQAGMLTNIKGPLLQSSSTGDEYRVAGIDVDKDGNVWLSNDGATQNLVVLKKDGSNNRFAVPFGNSTRRLIVDDANIKWIAADDDNGLFAFSDGGTIDNPADDQWKWFRLGQGMGNLPDNNVLSMAKDRNNFIWVGTARGVAIIPCSEALFSNNSCEAFIPVVSRGNFNGFLFGDQRVQTIAVDGADRKWVGTTDGAYLISSDGLQTLHHFTAENSPLPSNDVTAITVEPLTGEVFFSTSRGIVSYRSTATEAEAGGSKVLIFPNPVPPGYSGTIAISGLPADAMVKITELNGRLVYQTRSNGGQATWNGRSLTGKSISSGVYLVLISGEENNNQLASKIVFISK